VSAPLPACPLCGATPIDQKSCIRHAFARESRGCSLVGLWFSPAEWRRLASPPLPATVADVLRACVEWQAEINDRNLADVTPVESRLDDCVTALVAAGLLPPGGEKE
jgi:hypothetical protein